MNMPENVEKVDIRVPCECGGRGLLERLDGRRWPVLVCQWCGRTRFVVNGLRIEAVHPRNVSPRMTP